MKKLERLSGIIYALKENKKMTAKELAAAFEVSERTIYRDIDALSQLKVLIENMVIETDAPSLTPHPLRGKRNEPAYVRYVAERIAELKEVPFEEVSAKTMENAKKFFKISDGRRFSAR